MFGLRWLVQVVASHRAKRPVIPRLFWYMSLAGSLMALSYFLFSAKQDAVGVLQNLLPAFTAAYKFSFPHIATMDRDFWVDAKCSGCGTCAKVCPVGNIVMAEGRPHWRHACVQCLACIQWCPTQALQYGKKTPNYPRYHHPEATLKDMIEAAARESA